MRKQLKNKLSDILFYLAEIAIAIEWLHSMNIVHRDIKPENILVDSAGHAKLIDLGLSKRLDANRTNTTCGTPGYLAPEQLKRKCNSCVSVGHGKEVDLWAYGVTVFELLAGYNPFYDPDPMAHFEKTAANEPCWPPYMNSFARKFIEKLLVVDPRERMRASEFRNDLLFKVTAPIKA